MELGSQLRLHNRGFCVVADFPKYRDTPSKSADTKVENGPYRAVLVKITRGSPGP